MARPPRLEDGLLHRSPPVFRDIFDVERQPLLNERETAGQLREQLLRSSQAHDIAVDAYMFMPDHVHLLLRGVTATAEHDSVRGRLQARRRVGVPAENGPGGCGRTVSTTACCVTSPTRCQFSPTSLLIRCAPASSPRRLSTSTGDHSTQTREEILERLKGMAGDTPAAHCPPRSDREHAAQRHGHDDLRRAIPAIP